MEFNGNQQVGVVETLNAHSLPQRHHHYAQAGVYRARRVQKAELVI